MLSADTMALLSQFLEERDAAEQAAKTEATDMGEALLTEADFGLSQFWYTPETSVTLARLLVRLWKEAREAGGPAPGKIGFLAAPSAFKAFRSLISAGAAPEDQDVPMDAGVVFEYDDRFAVFGDQFVHYDYRKPHDIPDGHIGAYSVLLVDPPFLNEPALAGFQATCTLLRQSSTTPVIAATGAMVSNFVQKLLGARPTMFPIAHTHGLSNPFRIYVPNGRDDLAETLGGWDEELEAAIEEDRATRGGDGRLELDTHAARK